jgi:hypothetical protein
MANRVGVEISITLLMGGMLVSGRLTSGRKYCQGVAEEIRSFVSPDSEARLDNLGEAMAQLLDNAAQSVYPEVDMETEPSDDELIPAYVHLRDSRFFHPGGPGLPVERGIWWRGRLTEVDGFFVGQFQPTTTSDAEPPAP